MTPDDAIQRLDAACIKDCDGRFFFGCKGAVVILRLHGVHEPIEFPARDKLAFRIDRKSLKIERRDTGEVQNVFSWDDIESLTAGEPEMAHGKLFQG